MMFSREWPLEWSFELAAFALFGEIKCFELTITYPRCVSPVSFPSLLVLELGLEVDEFAVSGTVGGLFAFLEVMPAAISW